MKNKFKEIYNVDDYEILTDSGWNDIDFVCKTKKYNMWFIKLEDGKELLCANDHILFSNNKEVYVKNLKIGDYVDIIDNKQSKVIKCKCLNYKENMYDVQVKGEKYFSNNILSHNTTIMSIYILWFSIFHSNKNIGIVSNKETSAKMILLRIKKMYESLPMWLKPGVTEYSKTFTSFDNNTRIIISATSADAFRSETINILCADEFAFVPSFQAEEFWAANYPTISASKESKIILISTPNGLFNIFHRIWTHSRNKLNTFTNTKISWEIVPGRNRKWADEQIKNLGQQKFNQEFACIGKNTILEVYDTLTNKIIKVKAKKLYKKLTK